ncbi:PQQ-dependent sugar dehydrogenase [Leucobacter ruminantium]|uniref:PQQ-dependent sugar dehydrogenase n=1 Tax=Leucobacter ruminantium TaxID=1289170 RepID=A0A939LVE5_9MICO|nr:PQQ-dependent sugar dehydrogenase [Leucobacter ruminantium]MBO1805529.1 PQQ-dependent sugar dehydrogenase [Leucobacter ruminantium]
MRDRRSGAAAVARGGACGPAPPRAAARAVAVAAALALAGVLGGCAGEAGGEPAPTGGGSEPESGAEALSAPAPVVSGLEAPWSVVFHEGTPILSERDSGRILLLDPEGEVVELVTVDSTHRVEGGLLGLAVRDDHLYAYATFGDENRIVRYPLIGEGSSLAAGDPEPVLSGIPAGTNHNGGRIAFGPDGMLYATTGDAGDTDHAQDLDSLAGKILRMTPDGGVPSDNPFEGSHVYSYGHRNPQGIAWAEDGTMYASEFGQNTWDELNVIEAGGDYGWPEAEGLSGDARYIDPVQQWEPANASPSGIATHEGSIWIANLRGASLREVPLDAPASSVVHYAGEYGRIRDIAVAPDGRLWMVTGNTDGRGDPSPQDDRILRLPAP